MQGEDGKRIGQQTRPYLLRRGTAAPSGGSFKRRSLKLRRGTKEGKEMDVDCIPNQFDSVLWFSLLSKT